MLGVGNSEGGLPAKVVTKQWRNWAMLGAISITNGQDGHSVSPNVIFLSVLPVVEIGLKQRISRG